MQPKDGKGPARAGKGKSRKDADTLALERRVSDALGLNVSIEHRGKGGMVHVAYGDLEQMEMVLASWSGSRAIAQTIVARMERSKIAGRAVPWALRCAPCGLRSAQRRIAMDSLSAQLRSDGGTVFLSRSTVADRRSSVLY